MRLCSKVVNNTGHAYALLQNYQVDLGESGDLVPTAVVHTKNDTIQRLNNIEVKIIHYGHY